MKVLATHCNMMAIMYATEIHNVHFKAGKSQLNLTYDVNEMES